MEYLFIKTMKTKLTQFTIFTLTAVSMVLTSQAKSSTESLNLNSEERMLHRRAVDAVIWSMPLVNFQAMRDGLKKDAGIGLNDVAYHSKVQNWNTMQTAWQST